MEITKEVLETYRSKKAEIGELDYLINNIHKDDTMVGNDVIMDYQTGYGRPQTVVGFDQEKYRKRIERYQNRKSVLEVECEEMETFVEAIQDSITRRIFRLYFIVGAGRPNQQKIADKINMERSNISKKIDNYLKLSHTSQKAQV